MGSMQYCDDEPDELGEDGFAEGEAKGKAEGLVEGESKGAAAAKAETARVMLAEGLTIDLVAKCTGLTTKQITAL